MSMERSSSEGVCRPYGIKELFVNRKNGLWPAGGLDSNVVSASHFNSDLSDFSGKTWTAAGNAAVSNAQSKFGNYSLRLDNSLSQHITTPNSADFNFDSLTLFTIDFWLYLVSQTSYSALFSTAVSGTGAYVLWMGGISGSDEGKVCFGTNGANTTWASQTGCSTGSWHHIAIVRKNTTSSGLGVAVDGSFGTWGSGAVTVNSHGSGAAWGRFYISGSTYYPNCYIDETRISKGIARWTENFTPPTVPYF